MSKTFLSVTHKAPQIIEELEVEKKKIEDDLRNLKDQHENRRKRTLSVGSGVGSGVSYIKGRVSQPHASKKNDWLHISGLIAEANEISNRLQQNTVFRRLDNYMDSDEPQIKLHNTKLGISTTWNLPTFEQRLEQIGIVYQQIVDQGLDASAADELFYNPDDEWTRDAGPSALNWVNKPKAKSMFDLGGVLGSGALPASADAYMKRRQSANGTPEVGEQPRPIAELPEATVPLLCRKYITNSLASLQNLNRQRTAADDIVEAASAMRAAVDTLKKSFEKHSGDPVVLCARGEVRNASMSATMSMELLCSTIRTLGRGNAGGLTLEQICDSLASAAVNTGSSLGKLMQGIENGVAPMVRDGLRVM